MIHSKPSPPAGRRSGISIRVLGCISLIAWTCGLLHASEPQVIDRIAAIVNNDVISLFDVNRTAAPYAEKIKSMGYPESQETELLNKLKGDVLNQLIDQKLTDQETQKAKITVSEAEVDGAIEKLKDRGRLSDEEMIDALKKDGISLTEYRTRVKEQILRAKLLDQEVKSKIIITPEDIETYYEAHPDERSTSKKYHLRQIMLSFSSLSPESERKAAEEKMKEIIDQFQKGAPFADLAKAHSNSPLAEDGGDLGLISFDDISQALRPAIAPLKAGEITPVLETDEGIQLIYVESISDPSEGGGQDKATAEIEEKLYRQIVDDKFNTWLSELREKSHIQVFPMQ